MQEDMGEYETSEVIDQQNVEIRKKNIIIFNAPISSHKASKNRKEDDRSLSNNVCNEITQAHHLWIRSGSGKIRPLLITLNSEKGKKKNFSWLYKLKGENEIID